MPIVLTRKKKVLKTPKLKGFFDGLGGQDIRQMRWLTPKVLVARLGHFDLDPAGAPDWQLADRTFLPENGEDGLKLDWDGRVWLNPPYGREATPFLRKMVRHGHGTVLTFARTETEIFFETVWDAAHTVLFLKGRLKFFDNEKRTQAPFNSGAPSCLVAYGKSDAQALEASGLAGQLIKLK